MNARLTESQFMIGLSVDVRDGQITIETLTKTLKGEGVMHSSETFDDTELQTAIDVSLSAVAAEIARKMEVRHD